jgi:hypothetical protein
VRPADEVNNTFTGWTHPDKLNPVYLDFLKD